MNINDFDEALALTYVLDEVFSSAEAAAIIAGSERAGFTSSYTRTGGFENMYTCQGSGCCCGKKLGLSCIFL